MNAGRIVIYCGLLLALSAFSIDIMLPVFGGIGENLRAADDAVKMTVTFYLFAFGVGQVIFGPLADRCGRKPALVIGLSVYLAGAAACSIAFSIEMLLAGRLLQGIGGAAGHVIGRAIIRDLFSGRELARNMAMATAVFSFGPLVAPLLGYFVGEVFNWRGVFWAMLAFGAAMLAVAVLALPETAPACNPHAMRLRVLRESTLTFWQCAQSRYFWFLGGWMAMMMHYYLANAAQLYEQNFGVVGFWFALLFATHGIGIIVGQFGNRALIHKFGAVVSARVAALLLALACGVLLALGLLQWLTVAGFALLIFMFAIGYLVVVSNASALAMEPHGNMAGFASSFIGFGYMTTGAVGASVLTLLTGGELLPWAVATFIINIGALAMLMKWRSVKEGLNNY